MRHWIHRGLCFHGNRLRDKQTAREINHPINKTTSNRVSACTAGAYAMPLVAALIKIIPILLRCLQPQQRRYVSNLSTSSYQFDLSGNQTQRRDRVISRACRLRTSGHDRCQWEEGSFYMQSLWLLHQRQVLMLVKYPIQAPALIRTCDGFFERLGVIQLYSMWSLNKHLQENVFVKASSCKGQIMLLSSTSLSISG